MPKTIFITGVSSGLGHGLASCFLEKGATVYGCSRRAPESLIDRGLHFRSIDLSDASAGPPALADWLGEVEQIDLAVLNAGKLGEIRDMREAPLEDLKETMEINVWANKWILDHLLAEGRRLVQVVAISSGASLSGSRGWNGYSLSKAALNMLVKLYAGEAADTHFTALAPGLVDTAMQDYLTGLPADDRYQPLETLKAAKGTEKMPDGETCARDLVEIFPKLLERESGQYADVRKL